MLNFEFFQLSDFQFQHFLPVVPVASARQILKLSEHRSGEADNHPHQVGVELGHQSLDMKHGKS